MEHEDLVDELLELIEAENKADLQARAAYMVGNIKKSRHYAGLRVKAQEALLQFLDSVTITKRTDR